MKKILLNEINIRSLIKLDNQGTKSTIYRDKNNVSCFKIFDNDLSNYERNIMYSKFNAIINDGIDNRHLLLPKIAIVDKNNNFCGYINNFIPNSQDIGNKYYYTKGVIDTGKIFKATKNASKALREIHDLNLVLRDLNYGNILEDNKNNIYFCDLDDCKYGVYDGIYIAAPLGPYLDGEIININQNSDRFSMMICFLVTIFNKDVNNIGYKEYDELSEKLQTLKNMRHYFELAKKHEYDFRYFPYIDELIDKNDKVKIRKKWRF